MTQAGRWSLLRFGVVGGVLVLIQIGFNPSSLKHTPSPIPLPPYILSLHPPITCHPKGVIQARSLERNGLKREAGLLAASLSPSLSVCVCEVKCSLCGMAVCQEGKGGEVRGEQMDSLSSPFCIVPTSLSLYLPFYLLSVSLSLPSPHTFLASCLPFTPSFLPLPPSFSLCCLVADGSMGQQRQQQQQQQSRSQSVSKKWGEEKGVVERRGGGGEGEGRWGSGIWRAWLRGPLRGSVYVRVVV